MPRYRTTLRPAPSGGLPHGVGWRYAEWPSDWRLAENRPRAAVVSRWRYGVIETDRPLTAAEMKHFDIVEVEE